ncbi:MAG TPA: DUF4337 family protein [Gemmatales bacterium]|nr:DUF4337 family protein [Gemmatales bacterium]
MTPKEAINKLEQPKGRWGKILATTPIVMTVLATVFAGLSSSEMTQAMFHRSLASQQQSKAGDQWAFFQAKKIRGTTLEANIEMLQTLAHAVPLQEKQLQTTIEQLQGSLTSSTIAAKEQSSASLKELQAKVAPLITAETESYWKALSGGQLPKLDIARHEDASIEKNLEAALKAIEQRQKEESVYQLVKKLTLEQIIHATELAEKVSEQFSQQCEPTSDFGKKLKVWLTQLERYVQSLREQWPQVDTDRRHPVRLLERQIAGAKVALSDFDVRRYRQEAIYNRKIAELYELRVWRSSMESDRHRTRSELFFYSMLVAQVGVTISSLALAQAKRSALWFIAAFAGLIALGFSLWVYLTA